VADLADVDIESVNLSGDGVARVGRASMTVPFTIPGERVRVRLGAARAGIITGSLVQVLRASPERVQPRCRHFGPHAKHGQTCGGCAWQHIAYPAQLAFKTDLVTRVVREKVRTAPAALPMLAATPEDEPWHYRNKVHFVVERRHPRGLVMGHYARSSRHVVAIEECPVHDERGNAVAFALRDACQQADTRGVKSIAVRTSVSRAETMAALVVTNERDKQVRTASRRVLAGQTAPTSLHVNIHPRGDAFIFGTETRHIAGPERLREDVGTAFFLISPTAFFQTNVRAARILVEQVLAAVPKDARVLDLYAGAGLFALPLALSGHVVVAIEENRDAVVDGQASLRLSRVPERQCRFIAKPVELALGRTRDVALQEFDAVVLDPPREGCQSSVIDRVFGQQGPARAVYVSCDPESLARDLARITACGYRIASLQPVDMFPHTPHIETVAVLSRTG
jgi:23S rRNA (uracil1939-C5)-methyltransferase